MATNDTKYQNKAAVAVAYEVKLLKNRLNLSANARGEVINTRHVLLPGVNASFGSTEWLTIRGNLQKTYRAPTLNELYYNPGGNTSLKPENGWTEDAGYTLHGTNGRLSFNHDVSLFNRDIHDWILWLGGAIWTPHNIAQVHSRGIETENSLLYTTGPWKLHVGVNTSYVIATTVSSYIPNDGSIGKQLPYTPRYNGQANAGFSFKAFTFNYNQTYTGYRFTVSDESGYLAPYKTGNVQVLYSIHVRHRALILTGQCNNVWNERYTVVANRPMPGINLLAGFKAEL